MIKSTSRLSILFIFSGVFILSSCKKESIKGTGAIITQTREVSNFYNVSAYGHIEATVGFGTQFKVEIKGYENMLPHLNTKVENGTLIIRFDSKVNVQDDVVEVHITMPSLKAVTAVDDGKIIVKNAFPNMDNLTASSFDKGSVEVMDGSARLIKGILSGTGKISAFGLFTEKAQLEINGGGQIEVSVRDNLNVKIDGSGIVYYKGNPELYTQITGTGQVIKK
ncbi:MAG: DUF2807 domain-containing protein [Chitinophagaceae bacterium]|nr:DUF2807 domain-containing protein [Chitinophagaceae bacterium]